MKSLLSSIKANLSRRIEFSSDEYWRRRYENGGNSGPGSYGHLAKFKADTLNRFVKEKQISSIVEFGCGDGNQLALAQYPQYIGYDISSVAVDACRSRFVSDATKKFLLAQDYDGRCAELALSLDVIFHLIEDEIFVAYMRRLFAAAREYVVIYSSNYDVPSDQSSQHVRHRRFTAWVEQAYVNEWRLVQTIHNDYPYDGDYESTSFSEFFFYQRS